MQLGHARFFGRQQFRDARRMLFHLRQRGHGVAIPPQQVEGKLKLAIPVRRYVIEHVGANGFRMPDIRMAHIWRVESLAPHHRDPFDRLLMAQAVEEKLPVVTADPVFRDYGVKRIW